MMYGEYLVTGSRRYRGHEPGSRFEARLDRLAEARAIQRGDIRLLRHITPSVAGQPFQLPDGWLTDEPSPTPNTAGGG